MQFIQTFLSFSILCVDGIKVMPSREVWEGGTVTIQCSRKGVGEPVIWVRQPFTGESGWEGERELLAHDDLVLIDDNRYKVEKENIKDSTISKIQVIWIFSKCCG